MSRDKVSYRAKKVCEDAPTNSVAAGGVAGLDSSTSLKKNIMMPMQRRKQNFAGAAVFEVNSNLFHSLTFQKRKGKHWRTYLEEDDSFSEIREYANTHKGPIAIQNERTGEMRYVRYK